jgi:acyl dehydratase
VEFDLGSLGRWSPERRFTVERDRIRAYAAATNETAPAFVDGEVAPPVFAVLPIWETIHEATAGVVPEEARPRVLHGEQDMFLHRPLVPGMELVARSAVVGVHAKPSGTTVVVRAETRDAEGELVNEQYVTEFYRGVLGEASGGEAAPGHRFPEELAASEPAAAVPERIDEDQTFRYAEASGDHFRIHLDEEFARQAGLPGIIVHGLCVMAFTARAALQAEGGEARVQRLAVRFARPIRPGAEMTTRLWRLEPGVYAYDVTDGSGEAVIRDGRAELTRG